MALESLVFAIPTTDLVGAGEKVAKFFGKDGKKLTTIAKIIKVLGTAEACRIAANRTGQGIASLIDDYAVAGRKIDLQFWLRTFGTGVGAVQTTAYGRTLGKDILQYTNIESKLQELMDYSEGEPITLYCEEKTIPRRGEEIVNGGNTVEVKLSKKKYPESAQHIEEAIKDGQPNTLTIDRGGASSRRKASLKGVDTVPGLDRDEYPPAMSKEGGTGASIKLIDPSDNRGSGSSISSQLRKHPNGTKYRIVITDED